jgi:hypothetical protein
MSTSKRQIDGDEGISVMNLQSMGSLEGSAGAESVGSGKDGVGAAGALGLAGSVTSTVLCALIPRLISKLKEPTVDGNEHFIPRRVGKLSLGHFKNLGQVSNLGSTAIGVELHIRFNTSVEL